MRSPIVEQVPLRDAYSGVSSPFGERFGRELASGSVRIAVRMLPTARLHRIRDVSAERETLKRPYLREERDSAAAKDAAGIWARATARRDQLPVAVPPEEKLPGIQSALAQEGAVLLMVRLKGQALAFSIVIPCREVLEIRYLAVDPEAWGTGIARQLLSHLREHSLKEKTPLELWVIADNSRAIAAYESAGWIPTSDMTVRGSAGRVERRYVLSC